MAVLCCDVMSRSCRHAADRGGPCKAIDVSFGDKAVPLIGCTSNDPRRSTAMVWFIADPNKRSTRPMNDASLPGVMTGLAP
jgi:hypothetical protein